MEKILDINNRKGFKGFPDEESWFKNDIFKV